jgi:hypothetical protein
VFGEGRERETGGAGAGGGGYDIQPPRLMGAGLEPVVAPPLFSQPSSQQQQQDKGKGKEIEGESGFTSIMGRNGDTPFNYPDMTGGVGWNPAPPPAAQMQQQASKIGRNRTDTMVFTDLNSSPAGSRLNVNTAEPAGSGIVAGGEELTSPQEGEEEEPMTVTTNTTFGARSAVVEEASPVGPEEPLDLGAAAATTNDSEEEKEREGGPDAVAPAVPVVEADITSSQPTTTEAEAEAEASSVEAHPLAPAPGEGAFASSQVEAVPPTAPLATSASEAGTAAAGEEVDIASEEATKESEQEEVKDKPDVVIGDTGEVEIVPSSSPSTTTDPTEPEDSAAAVSEETKAKEDSEEGKEEEGGEVPVEGEKPESAGGAEEEKKPEESG